SYAQPTFGAVPTGNLKRVSPGQWNVPKFGQYLNNGFPVFPPTGFPVVRPGNTACMAWSGVMPAKVMTWPYQNPPPSPKGTMRSLLSSEYMTKAYAICFWFPRQAA